MICEFHLTRTFRQLLTSSRISASRIRYFTSNLVPPVKPIRSIAQYYALATGTILFYDYFLTLTDEVHRYPSLNILRFYTDITS